MSWIRQTLVSVLVVPMFSSAVPAPQRPTASDLDAVRRISQQQFRTLHAAGKVLVVDVRSEPAFDLGHIARAVNAPLLEIERHAGALVKQAGSNRIVTYCSCPYEHTAAEAAFVLAKHGAKSVSALAGGYVDWVMTGGKVERRGALTSSEGTGA